jgi:thymidine kinase
MLHLTLGCMFSGKTTALIRDQYINHGLIIDYDTNKTSMLVSHDGVEIPCTSTTTLLDVVVNTEFIYINEAQFFPDLIEFVTRMLHLHKHVYVYGLDGDFKQEKFGSILDLIPMSDTYTKLYAECKICRKNAAFSKRLTSHSEQYRPHDEYIPVCRKCLL